MAKIIPAISELDALPTGLTLGEWYVLNAVRSLDHGWNVFVHPTLDLGQPNFVIAHPLYGVCVVEVKDWSLGDYRQDFDGRIEVLTSTGWVPTSERPRQDAHRFRSEIIARFFNEFGSPSAKLNLVRAVVIMPRLRTGDAREMLSIPQAGGRGEQSVEIWGGGMLKIALPAVLTGRAKPARRKIPVDAFNLLCHTLSQTDFAEPLELVR